MNKTIFLLISVFVYSSLLAQDSSNKKPLTLQLSYGSVTVKDSSGKSYSLAEWQPLVISGEYILKPIDPTKKKNDFLLLHASDSIKKEKIGGPRPLPSDYFKTGERFRDFASKDTGENNISTADFAGKILVLNFWFIDCPPCRSEIPALNNLSESYKNDSSVVFIAVALDGKARLKNFLQANPFGYKMIYNGRSIAAQYGIGLFPTNVVVDRQGKVNFHTTGLTNNTVPWIRKTIEELKKQ